MKNSTDIYDDMLINGITLDDADWIEWCEGKVLPADMIERKWRRNVAEYVECGGVWKKNDIVDGRDSFSISGTRYVKCPFGWQFRV